MLHQCTSVNIFLLENGILLYLHIQNRHEALIVHFFSDGSIETRLNCRNMSHARVCKTFAVVVGRVLTKATQREPDGKSQKGGKAKS